MDKTCGTCGKCRNTHDGPYCYKGSSPRPVSTIRVMDCWVDPSLEEKAPVATKVCPRCGRELPVSEFGRHSRTKDGYQPLCRECRSASVKGKTQEHTPKRKSEHPSYVDETTGETMKWCNCCQQYKPITEFYRHKDNKDGHASNCKACHNKTSVEAQRRRAATKKAEKGQTEGGTPAPEKKEIALKEFQEAAAKGQNPGETVIQITDPILVKVKEPVDLEDTPITDIINELRRRGFHGSITMEI